jgi:Flp pilus assembly protein TadB
MLGMMAHGEANDVNVRADHSSRLAPFARAFVCACIVIAGLMIGGAQDGSVLLFTLLVAVAIWMAMKRSAKREEQRKAEQLGFHYPRVQGSAGAASDDELERKGWV